MKNLLFLALLSSVLVLGACSKEEATAQLADTENAKAEVKEKDIELNPSTSLIKEKEANQDREGNYILSLDGSGNPTLLGFPLDTPYQEIYKTFEAYFTDVENPVEEEIPGYKPSIDGDEWSDPRSTSPLDSFGVLKTYTSFLIDSSDTLVFMRIFDQNHNYIDSLGKYDIYDLPEMTHWVDSKLFHEFEGDVYYDAHDFYLVNDEAFVQLSISSTPKIDSYSTDISIYSKEEYPELAKEIPVDQKVSLEEAWKIYLEECLYASEEEFIAAEKEFQLQLKEEAEYEKEKEEKIKESKDYSPIDFPDMTHIEFKELEPLNQQIYLDQLVQNNPDLQIDSSTLYDILNEYSRTTTTSRTLHDLILTIVEYGEL